MSALPPRGFVSAGEVLRAEYAARPAFHHDTGPSLLTTSAVARYERGLRYQRQVESALGAWADSTETVTRVELGPWFRFTSAAAPSVWRWCQPDVLVTSSAGALTVLEVKLTLEARAWWQVVELYAPVVAKALSATVCGGIIAKSVDLLATNQRINGALVFTLDRPHYWLSTVTSGEAAAALKALPVLQWKRPSASAFSTAANQRSESA